MPGNRQVGHGQAWPEPSHQQFLAAAAAGLGREDDSAVIKVFQKLTGIELPAEKDGK